MKYRSSIISSSLILLVSLTVGSGVQDGAYESLQDAIHRQEELDSGSQALSRRKRFLTFPEGSSLQLVFCCQTAALIPIGDIFLYGNTAALAWQLPQDPEILRTLKGGAGGGPLRRKDDTKNIYYTDEKGKVLFKVPYKRRIIVNPAFSKRSVREPFQFRNSLPQDERRAPEVRAPEGPPVVNRTRMHAAQQTRDFLKMEHMGAATVEFHRHSRKGLYEKLEVFLKALGLNGRECVRRVLCETGSRRADDRQGSIVQEMVRAVFTLPRGREFDKERHREYDAAHGAAAGAADAAACERLYPDCDGDVTDLPIFV